MEAPVFPKEFVEKHCWKVSEARDWRKAFNLPDDPEADVLFAECAFNNAGCGIQCESCEKFLAGVHMTAEEEKFLPMIRKFYKDQAAYEKEQARLDKDERRRIRKEEQALLDLGAGI